MIPWLGFTCVVGMEECRKHIIVPLYMDIRTDSFDKSLVKSTHTHGRHSHVFLKFKYSEKAT